MQVSAAVFYRKDIWLLKKKESEAYPWLEICIMLQLSHLFQRERSQSQLFLRKNLSQNKEHA